MVVIRLARSGAKKKPFYHVVAADKRRARDSKYLERLGFLNLQAKGDEEKLRLNQERLDYWLSQGAQPSERVAHLIKQFSKGITTENLDTKRVAMLAKKIKAKEDAKVAALKAKEAEEKAGEAAKAAEEKAAKAAAEAEAAPAEKAPKGEPKAEEAPKEAKAEETPKKDADKAE